MAAGKKIKSITTKSGRVFRVNGIKIGRLIAYIGSIELAGNVYVVRDVIGYKEEIPVAEVDPNSIEEC